MSEGGRLSNKMYQQQCIQNENALKRAHMIYGASCIDASCITPKQYKQETPSESDYLATKVCTPPIVGVSCALSSSLTLRRNQCVIDKSTNPLDPLLRFAQYNLPALPPVCPAVPTEVLNAYLPKASTKCPIPNRPTQSIV